MARRELPEVACPPGTVVIGDLHLDVFGGSGPRRFVEWLERLGPIPRLVVLGDLFEFWVGRGQEREPAAGEILRALARRVAAGTAVDLLHGNRDFLVGADVTAATGARVRPRGLVGREGDGGRTLFLHGDELCVADRAYRRFRAAVRSGPARALARAAPLALRRSLALRLRRRSGRSTAAKTAEVVEMKAAAADRFAREAKARTLICGHAHRFRDEVLPGGARWVVIDGWGGRRDTLRLGETGWEPLASRGPIDPGAGNPTLFTPPAAAGGHRRMIVAIDGPAASGKSTVARALAARLGLSFLDTGAMYRAVTVAALERGIDPADGEACARIASELDLRFDEEGRILIDGEPGEPRIRGPEVDAHVSVVAAHSSVRRALVPMQREAAAAGAVAEGRDTTTVVFPAADHKFFLIASPSERARRRARQEGHPEREGEYARALERRDRLDSTRGDSPLRRGDDTELIETDGLAPEEVVDRLVARVRGGAPA